MRHRRGLLQVITDADRRGAQVFAVELASALLAAGRHVRTVGLARGHDRDGLAVELLGRSRLGPATLLALRRASGAARCVVAHGSSTLPACAIASRAPFVYRNIGDPLHWAGAGARLARVRLFLRRAACVVALGEGFADAIADRFGVPRERVTVIPNAVDATRFRPAAEGEQLRARERFGVPVDGPVVAYVGALGVEKDVAAAIRAVARLDGSILLVAGDGPLRSELETLAGRVASGRVVFAGRVDDARQVYLAADAVVLPSRSEGMPAALIEAGMCGVPCVATAVGAVRDVVVHGVTGLVVPPGDVDALREGLEAVLASPGDRGERARAHCAGRFDMRVVAARWDELLARLGAWTEPVIG